ncbi:MAG TPA: nucleotidyltransferase family protein [Nitrososphaerales archaeon]|nr:nucleotidyltransferase family protein [Nitrososphaerales archaeon]
MRRDPVAAILCGGRGERLKPLTDYFQKAMVPIGPKKLPLLSYIIRLMTHHGISRVALLTGYKSEDIRHYFGDGSESGVAMTYSVDRKGSKGSLNAVANALRNGAIPRCDELLVYYGDVLTDLDITALLSLHRGKKADVTLVLAKGYQIPVGTAEVKGGMVTAFREKPTLDFNVTTGCMVAGPKAMALMKRVAGGDNTDLMTHFIPRLLSNGGKVAAYYTGQEWFDVGTISSLEKLNDELLRHPLSFLD